MSCKDYLKSYPKFSKMPLGREIFESDEYENWVEHGFECETCSLWDLEQRVIARGHDFLKYPCAHIAYHSTMTCDDHDDPWECPDMTLVRTKRGYGIPVRDGGSSYIKIKHCPWCGIML